MAGKVQLPSASIFTSDPLEQIMGRGVLDRDMSGLSNMFLYAMGNKREQNQDAYLGGVAAANKLALEEARQEEANKMLMEQLKQGTELAKVGYQPSNMPIMNKLFGDNTPGGGSDKMAMLLQALKQAQINKANAEAAGAGAASGDKIEVKTDIGPGGQGFTTYKGKGPNADARVQEMVAARMRQLGLNPNQTTNPAEANAMLQRRSYGVE